MSQPRFLVLGSGEGWHSNQLVAATKALNCRLDFAPYETLSANVIRDDASLVADDLGDIGDYDAILTRTMPAGSLEKITFRLAVMHSLSARGITIVNPPRGLEIAIDKFATLDLVARMGYDVPETRVVQSRTDAMDAFNELGGDCVVKPLFGGEGRGVMRIRDAELAWYSFSTLDQLDAVFYVQRFVPPGGRDTRLLCMGQQVYGIRRENDREFRTNVNAGARASLVTPTPEQVHIAQRILAEIGLQFASVDFIDNENGAPLVLEVNAVPGWRGAQSVVQESIASQIVKLLIQESACRSDFDSAGLGASS